VTKAARRLAVAFVVAAALSASGMDAARQPAPDEQAIRDAEDARAPDAARLSIITAGLRGGPDLLRIAVRALGRLEREALVEVIAPLLASRDPRVRAEAVNAIGQSVVRGKAASAWQVLTSRAAVEDDGPVRGVLARTFGRLPYETSDEVRKAEEVVLSLAKGAADGHEGVAHGLETLARRRGKLSPPGPAARAWLRERVLSSASTAFLIRTSLRALVAARDVDEALVRAAAAHADDQVRRLAVAAAGVAKGQVWAASALECGLEDRSFLVRHESPAGLAGAVGLESCPLIVRACGDSSLHVRLRAIDLAGACSGNQAAADAVTRAASFIEGKPDAGSWHAPAHALVSMARLTPERVPAVAAAAARSDVWQVRMYAARAAGLAGVATVLVALASDPDDNVRNAAIESMSEGIRRDAAPVIVAALDARDPQLVRTAALALKGTPIGAGAVTALAGALERTTRPQRDTSRDVRIALIDRIAELGRGEEAARAALRARLEDFDPVVAGHAARVLSTWTGRTIEPRPRPRARHPFPTAAERAECERLEAVVTMAGGGRFRMRLFPEEAPTNAWRFVRLARAGWFDRLTFHRVEPGFVVQGGSPGANEYAGDGPYTRDEVGLRSHTRGTVGLSTRGRDTGDGQIFINLVDNIRLDHDYTIFGEVIEGMDVVDRIVEGDVIAGVEIVEVKGP
jgi:cyclophilin family peptidyl-prolyl cis-trans isomerase/HEAT repeat protein